MTTKVPAANVKLKRGPGRTRGLSRPGLNFCHQTLFSRRGNGDGAEAADWNMYALDDWRSVDRLATY